MWFPVVLVLAAGGCHRIFGVEPDVPADADVVDVLVDVPFDAPDVGCADGSREGFELALEPDIAGCSGAWSLAGISTPRAGCVGAGNDALDQTGIGCSVADLCAPGWHICTDKTDLAAHLADVDHCTWDAVLDDRAFFASAQPGFYSKCAQGTDDLYGCGSLGVAPEVDSGCEPFARSSGNVCTTLTVGGWMCGSDNLREAAVVTKTQVTGGGALCCRDDP